MTFPWQSAGEVGGVFLFAICAVVVVLWLWAAFDSPSRPRDGQPTETEMRARILAAFNVTEEMVTAIDDGYTAAQAEAREDEEQFKEHARRVSERFSVKVSDELSRGRDPRIIDWQKEGWWK